MKRLFFTFILATISGISAFSQDFLQVNALSKDNISLYKQKSSIQRNGETIIWSCDFEEGSPEYTFTMGNNTANGWQLVSEATYPITIINSAQTDFLFYPMNFSGHSGWQTEPFQISETPEHWCLFDMITPSRADADLSADASINFTNIDLTSCQCPKLTFLQSYRVLNEAGMPMKVSTSLNGGATWTDHVVNIGTYETYDYVNGLVEVLIPEAGGQSNVTIRINVQNNNVYGPAPNVYAVNYGWQVDDIKIVEIPPCDLRLIDARISMFGYVDYRNVPATFPVDNWTSMTAAEKRNYVYQYYDPYAQSPRQQWVTDNGYAAFNVEVLSMGSLSVIPKVRIKITNPNGSEIYNKVVSGARTLSPAEGDTVDYAYIDRGNPSASTMFFFENEEDIIVGRYTVDFYVFADGMDDADTINNHTTQYFDITENSFSKSYYEPTSNFKTNGYTASSNGDMYGTRFTYFYSPNAIMSADLFIAEGTTPGTSVRLVLFENNDGNLIQRGTSDLLNIGEENIGVWNTFLFSPEYNFSFASNETSREVIVAAQFYYDYNGDIYVGRSDVLSSYRHNSLGKFTYQEVFYNGYPDIALTFHTGAVGASTITVLSANESMGYVNGGGTFYEETQVTISATPYAGYRFVRWNDGNTDNPRTITVTEDATYIASFEVNAYYSSFTATACGSYTWNDHTYTESGEYQQTFTASNSADSIVTLNLTIYAMPQPEITASGVLDGCNPSPITLSAGNYSAYNWSTGATTATISISEPGYYYVEVTGENGCIGISDQINVGISNAIPDAPQIAVVGLNNLNQNVVSWSAVENTNVNAYRIYRENNVANVYEPMATVEVSAQTFWTDETADPSARAYRYKITAVDECGGESPMSDYHKTMHLTINQGIGNTWNLIWSHYEGFDFGTYRIYRGTMPSNMTMIGEVPSNLNSYTDNTATDNTGFYYQVEVVRNNRSRDAEISSRSNIVDNGIFPEYTITVMSANPNRGTVTGGGTYPEGTVITIEATALDGFVFASWSDENTENPRQITVTGNATYIASFDEVSTVPEYTITVMSANPNRGTVTGGGTYPEGTIVRIEANALDGFVFTSWSDDNTDNPRYITVTENATYIASFDPATGIEENATLEIALYPNPATDILNITSSETISEIEIVNVMGQVVKRIEVNNDNAVCDVENLKAGVYVVRIRTASATLSQRRFIKE